MTQRIPYTTHVTRMSDSSLYDEVCILCGATDASGDGRLDRICPLGQFIHESHETHPIDHLTVGCKHCSGYVSPRAPHISKRLAMKCTEAPTPEPDETEPADEKDRLRFKLGATKVTVYPELTLDIEAFLTGKSGVPPLDTTVQLLVEEHVHDETVVTINPAPTPDDIEEDIKRRRTSFKDELAALINRHSIENGSNTADHILATYLLSCLSAYEKALTSREIYKLL